MSRDAFALLVLIGFALATPAAIIVLSWAKGLRARRATDLTPYECGVKPFESARRRFSVKFYLVAMLFIVFDVEAAFFYPWAVALKDQARAGRPGFVFGTMIVFLGILAIGYLYALGRGALEWDR